MKLKTRGKAGVKARRSYILGILRNGMYLLTRTAIELNSWTLPAVGCSLFSQLNDFSMAWSLTFPSRTSPT